MVIISTGVYNQQVDTRFQLGTDNNISYLVQEDDGSFARNMNDGTFVSAGNRPETIAFVDGLPQGEVGMGYLGIGVDQPLYTDSTRATAFTGTLYPREGWAEQESGARINALYGVGYRNSAPLTTLAFERGLDPIGLGWLGRMIVLVSVVLFAVSTSISWSYYGDRCANYIFGARAILPFKFVFVVMHFVGATLAVTTIWDLGDVALSLVTLPNVIALLLLSGVLAKLTNSYFERRPWEENAVVHQRVVAEKKAQKDLKKGGPKGPGAGNPPRV